MRGGEGEGVRGGEAAALVAYGDIGFELDEQLTHIETAVGGSPQQRGPVAEPTSEITRAKMSHAYHLRHSK